MKFLKLIILALLLTSISCQQSDDLLESTSADYSSTINQGNRADFTGKIKRIKIRKRRVGSGFKITSLVDGDTSSEVATIELFIEEQNGIIASPANSILELQETTNGVSYVFEEINFEGELDNQLIRISMMMKNDAGETLGAPSILYATIGDFEPVEGVDVRSIKVTKNPDNQHTIYGEIRGDNKDAVEAVYGIISDGVSYSEPFMLEQIENTTTANKYEFRGFGESSEFEIDDNSMGVIIIAHNGEGNMADYRQSNVNVNVNTGITFKPRRPGIFFYPSSTRLSAVVLGENRANANSVIGKLISPSFESPEFEMEVTGETSTKVLFDYIDESGDFDGLNNGENETIVLSYFVLNSNGDVIDSGETPITSYVDPAVQIKKPKLKINENEENFSLKVNISGENKNEVSYLMVTITPEDGGSETEAQEFLLELSNEGDSQNSFLIEDLQFIDLSNVIGQSYSITTVAFYSNGDPCIERSNCCVLCGNTDHF